MFIEIKDWRDGEPLYSGEHANLIAALEYCAANGAKLNYAELNYAELNGAKLNGAKLNDAKLNGAKLNGAKLNGAKLNGAKLNGAKLNDAELNGTGIFSLGQDQRGYHFLLFVDKGGPRITAGCRSLTLPEAWAHWKERHAARPILQAEIHARLQMAETICTYLKSEMDGGLTRITR